MSSTILITGAGGFLGGLVRPFLPLIGEANALQLSEALSANPEIRLILADVVEPKPPKSSTATTVKVDLTAKEAVDGLFTTEFGIPDTIYCLHGIMSRGSEVNFDLGLKVNFDSIRLTLQAAREFGAQSATRIKFIFASSLAVYGGVFPQTVTPETIATPEGAYGMGKLASELFVNEFSRRGFVDGRILRIPTIVVKKRPSGGNLLVHFRQGIESLCPIGDSLDSPELDLPLWLASPQTTIKNFVIARDIPADKFLPHTRVVYLPGFTATVRDELNALEKVGGRTALELVKFKDDPVSRRLVLSWPARFDITYPLSLGFIVDEGGMEPVVRQFQKDIEAGVV
ncbi:ABC bile acid [Mycena venus]|uniref:ABC bile acid n=1 Tax=Mycena venus TaxID=2733690 RepID=A0A8H6WUN3_9AGAR|nr:ABC bile acid [Mycena venus]